MRTCHGILIECIQQSLYKVLVPETIVVVFCILCFCFPFFVVLDLVYIILIMYMNIDFFNKLM